MPRKIDAMRCVALAMAVATVALLAVACGGRRQVDVPRRTAYCRINLYDTVYAAVSGLPLRLDVNTSAVVAVDSLGRGLDIVYPRYGATVYCSLTAVDSSTVGSALLNRMERISANLGDNMSHTLERENRYGFRTLMVVADGASQTPVQFIATDNRLMVSGVAFFEDARPDFDSISPVYGAIERDMSHLLMNLRR